MYVIGVDGGSTKTIAVVADEQGRVCGAARGQGSNWTGEDVEIPMAVVAETTRRALGAAGIQPEDTEIGVFTLAGADWPEDHTRRRAALEQEGITRRVLVKNDSFGGLRAGTRQPYGVVIAAGSGLNAAVITPEGQEWAFGYYETFGGASTISRHAFEAVLRAEDGRGQPTRLTGMVLNYLGFPTVEAMLRAYILGRVDLNRLLAVTPLVFEAALESDPVACDILVRQGEGLAEYATTLIRKFNLSKLDLDVVLAGSIFKGVGPLLVDTITQCVHRAAPRARIVRSRLEPVAGSVLLAYDALGIPVNEDMYTNLAATLPGEVFFSTR